MLDREGAHLGTLEGNGVARLELDQVERELDAPEDPAEAT